MTPVYKYYVLPGNFEFKYYLSIMANILENRFASRLNIFTLLRACFGPGRIIPPKTQERLNRPSHMNGSKYVQEENPKRTIGALDASPNGQTSDFTITRVISINYDAKGSMVLIEFGSEEGEKQGWYEYEEIRKNHGMSEALAKFQPTWDLAKPAGHQLRG
ncbi:hypothetical protein PEX2_055640 [Penicillium expansum]|uniref:Uncharacterized protein n=1 Tax=Penicillium expansum TaxID=27334 RepID=A0A0A2JVY3_PENEN|nr:hypothetical protein PEX2_055640 [Penicillium expansum]KGO59607.1 hypothetical protein PEX2_055640 [Penicillium expansum]